VKGGGGRQYKSSKGQASKNLGESKLKGGSEETVNLEQPEDLGGEELNLPRETGDGINSLGGLFEHGVDHKRTNA